MTTTGQDFTTYAGDAGQPQFTVKDGNGAVIDISGVLEILWSAGRDYIAAPVYTRLKSAGQIGFDGTNGVDGVFFLKIADGDTASLRGFYVHKAVITDASGNVSTVELGRWEVGASTPAWTYSGDPSLSDRDAVRNYIGDTDSANPQLFDAEIDYLLTQFGSPLLSAAQACRNLISRYARRVSKRVGDLSINYSDIVKNYTALAEQLQTQGEQAGANLYAGGTSVSDMESVDANTDRVRPPFQRKQFDIPNASQNIQAPPDEEFSPTP